MRVLGKIRPTVLDVFLVFAFFASTGMIWESTRPKGRPLSGLHVVPEQVELGEVDQVEGLLKEPDNLDAGHKRCRRLKEALSLNEPLAPGYHMDEKFRHRGTNTGHAS
jgi:hypothetical protein